MAFCSPHAPRRPAWIWRKSADAWDRPEPWSALHRRFWRSCPVERRVLATLPEALLSYIGYFFDGIPGKASGGPVAKSPPFVSCFFFGGNRSAFARILASASSRGKTYFHGRALRRLGDARRQRPGDFCDGKGAISRARCIRRGAG